MTAGRKQANRLAHEHKVVERAIAQIRAALATLSYASDGLYEDEAAVALDALDYLETWFKS